MKYAALIKYWQERPTLMEALVRKHHLFSKGFVYVGDSALEQTSPHFDKEVIKRLQGAEVMRIPLFIPSSGYLGGQEKTVEGKYQFFALFPEEEEKIPDTLPGGFRVERQQHENQVSPLRKIKQKSPSELLHKLSFERLGVLYENVEEFYFEPHQKENEGRQFPHTLTIDDVIILSRMEKEKKLDIARLKNKHSTTEDRRLGKRLEDIKLSPLLMRVERAAYALSPQAFDGMYVAIVHKKHLPEGFRE
ncbi:MAG: hypothetical protein AABX31_04715 [Nanoarchaeota archaeon]